MNARLSMGPVTSPAPPTPNLGTLTCSFALQSVDMLIYRLVISGPAQSIAYVYLDQITPASFKDVSYFGQVDSADYPAGLFVPAGSVLLVAWYSIFAPNTLTSPGAITSGLPGLANVTAEFEWAS